MGRARACFCASRRRFSARGEIARYTGASAGPGEPFHRWGLRVPGPVTAFLAGALLGGFAFWLTARRCAQSSCYWGFSWSCTGRSGGALPEGDARGVPRGGAGGLLAVMIQTGWGTSPLVELFLVVILFGCGTDFCLLLSWRFAEHWDQDAPSRAMTACPWPCQGAPANECRDGYRGLSLMGLTRFKLLSCTGPSVAIGLALTLAAAPDSDTGACCYCWHASVRGVSPGSPLHHPVSGRESRTVMARPLLVWMVILVILAVPAVYGMRVGVIHDLLAELPARTASVRDLNFIAEKFGPGTVALLAVVIESDQDLAPVSGLALIDDVSRLLARQPGIAEVRSATGGGGVGGAGLGERGEGERRRVVWRRLGVDCWGGGGGRGGGGGGGRVECGALGFMGSGSGGGTEWGGRGCSGAGVVCGGGVSERWGGAVLICSGLGREGDRDEREVAGLLCGAGWRFVGERGGFLWW